jgi:tRNA threonylcarbamoyladenosine biosynthesis protein TsaB
VPRTLDAPRTAGKTGGVKTVLAIAACGPRLELALAVEGSATGVVALAGATPRSELVVAAIDLLVRGAGLGSDALGAVVASRGPGSFTGVRVALATAQGLAAALGIPAHGFSSLLAQAARTDARECLAVQPARRGFAYTQAFSRNGAPVAAGEPAIAAIESLAGAVLPVVAPVGFPVPSGTPLATAPRSTAEALLLLMEAAASFDTATLVPVYLEPAPASRPGAPQPPWPPSRKAS